MEQYESQNSSITILINEFCIKKLDGRYFDDALNLISIIKRTKYSLSLERNPEIWAAAIMQVVLTKNQRKPGPSENRISAKEINEFFGTNISLTTKVISEVTLIQSTAYQYRTRTLTSRYFKKRVKRCSSNSIRRRNASMIGFNSNRKTNSVFMAKSSGLYTTLPESNTIPPKKEDGYITVEVLYGTNRTINLNSKKIEYNNVRGKDLHLGLCEISIPDTHKIGNLERPSWFEILNFKESKKKYITLLSNKNIDETEFLRVLKNKVGQSDEQDVLLFIHGYNVKFEDAMLRTAQLGYDLCFKGGMSAFSWPSKGTLKGYIADKDSARLSSNYLCSFIKLLVKENVKKLHIIAHSMGNVVLSEALIQLKQEDFFPNLIINQIILAAPDIDKDVFIQVIMPKIKGIARLTLYSSDKDKALETSRIIQGNYFRLGEGGENIVVVDGIESIDASQVDTDLLGHGYFAGTQSLLNDIHMVFLGLSPDKRMLDPKSKIIDGKSLVYWTFRNS